MCFHTIAVHIYVFLLWPLPQFRTLKDRTLDRLLISVPNAAQFFGTLKGLARTREALTAVLATTNAARVAK
jgi:hypothetical protein